MDAERSFERPAVAPDNSWSGHLRATLVLGLPLIGAQLAQMSIHVTDTVMIGQLGPEQLAAAVLSTQAFFLVWIFGSGFAQAVMPLAANAQGRGDIRGIRRSVRMGLWVIALYAVAVMPPLWHFEAILVSLGQDPAVAARAGAFMRVLQWGMFPALGIMGLRSYLSVLGRANVILLVTVAGALINGLLAYAFIFGHFGAPALGMQGAAYASLGTNAAMCAITVAYTVINPQLKLYELYVRFWRPDWPAFFEVVRLGLPISLTVIAETGMFGASTIMMGWLGAEALAAHGIALQLASVAFMVPLGLSNAGTVRVGIAFGRGDWQGLGRAGYMALALTMLTSGVAAVSFWLVPGTLIGLYLDTANPHSVPVLAQGIAMLVIGGVFQLVDGLQVTGSALLRGLKDTRVPMLIAAFSYWGIGVPVAYLLAFPLGFGGPGIWWGLAAGLALAATLMCWRFHRRAAWGLTPG